MRPSKKLLWFLGALYVAHSTIVGSGFASAAPATAPTGTPRGYDDLAAELADAVASAAAAAAAAAAVATTDDERSSTDVELENTDVDWLSQQKRMGGSPVDIAPIAAVMRAGYEAQRDVLVAMQAASRQRLHAMLSRMRQQGK